MYRKDYVRRSAAVVHEERSLDDLWDRKKPVLAEGRTFDPNRNTTFAEGAEGKTLFDPLAFLVGRVEVKYARRPGTDHVGRSREVYPAGKEDRDQRDRGAEAELRDRPVYARHAESPGSNRFPRRRAGGEIKLTDAVIRSSNNYATVTLVALDDKPLSESAKVLVQVGTMMRPTGWTTKATTIRSDDGKTMIKGEKIVNTGKMPWQVANTEVTVTLRNAVLARAVQLDVNGYKRKEIASTVKDGVIVVKLPADSLYVVLER